MKYGFYDRLTEDFPSQINVDVIEKCNYACIHCPYAILSKENKISNSKLSVELNKKLVDEVSQSGAGYTQQIRYSGGEPFLHPDILDILNYAVKHSGTMISVTTNGSIVSEEIANELLKMEIGLIDFSIDAYSDETYKQIRINGNLEKVRNHILYILKQKKSQNSKTRIIVSFVEQDKNKRETDQFRQYWNEQGVDYVVIRKLHSAGGFFYSNDTKPFPSRPCVYPWERIVLTAKGELAFCPANWRGRMVIHPDYLNTTIKETWIGNDYKKLRKEHLSGCFNAYKCCESCPDRYSTIWPDERTESWKGYGDMISELNEKL